MAWSNRSKKRLIISKNRNPVKLKTTPFYENRKFKKASSFPPATINRASPSLNIDLVDLNSSSSIYTFPFIELRKRDLKKGKKAKRFSKINKQTSWTENKD